MKRYRDCYLYCKSNQSVTDLFQKVAEESINKGYDIKVRSSLGVQDNIVIRIDKANLPISQLIIFKDVESMRLSVVNIVPLPESGISHLDIKVYNQLLDAYINDVLQPINQMDGNDLRTNSEIYTIEDVIPKSFKALKTWLDMYPLSCHPNDVHRWYDFVISLYRNGEHLSLKDFGEYLKENCNWSDEDIEEYELKLESHIDLIEYYDSHRGC